MIGGRPDGTYRQRSPERRTLARRAGGVILPRMTNQQKYAWAGVLSLFVSAMAMHWLITPRSHPDASGFRICAVYVQFVAGAVCALMAWRRSKNAAQASE